MTPHSVIVDTSTLRVNKPEYVCWMDVMGTGSIMSQSLQRASNFIIRLHASVIRSKLPNQRLYPMLDGIYITCPSQHDMLKLLHKAFHILAVEFTSTAEQNHRFIPKASLAYGPVVHGSTLARTVNPELAENPAIRDSLVLGLPVIEAHKGERSAPPFGIFVNISARTFSPKGSLPLPYVWWRWFNTTYTYPPDFLQRVTEHYAWCKANHYTEQYDEQRIAEHEKMAIEYLQSGLQP